MRRFRYGLDRCCVVSCSAYVANRWIVPSALKGTFLRDYFSDVLLIPSALPLVLWLHRRFGWRPDDSPPRWREILLHVAVWSMAAEGVAPHLFARATGDPWDVVAYAGGALASGVIWNHT